MNETELESLIIRLIGDGTEYQRMLHDAAEQTKAVADKVEHQSGRVESFVDHLEGFAGRALKVVGMLGIGYGFEQAFEKAEQLELGVIKLNAAIETNHGIVSKVVPEYKAFVAATMASSVAGKGEIFGLLRRAESYGISGEAAKKATKDALALAEVTDAGAEGALRIAAAIAQGDIETAQMFRRMIPQLRGAKTEEEFLDKYNRLVATGLKVMGEEAETAGGKIKQMEHAAADMSVKVGVIVQEAIVPVVKQLHEWVEAFDKLDPSVKRGIAQVIVFTAALGPAIYIGKQVVGVIGTVTSSLIALRSVEVSKHIYDTGVALLNLDSKAVMASRSMKLLQVAAVGAAIYGVRELAKELLGANAAEKELADSLARGEELTNRLRTMDTARREKAFSELGNAGTEEYVKGLEEQIKATEKDIAAKAKHRQAAEEEAYFYEHDIHKIARRNFFDAFGEQGILDNAKRQAKEYGADVQRLEEHLQKLRKAKDDADKALGGNPKVTEDIRSLIKDLEQERETMGMTARQAKVFALEMAGLGMKQADLLDQARKLAKELDEVEKFDKIADEVDELTKSLREEAETFGMTEGQVKLYKLAKEGATDAILAEARARTEAKEAMEEENKLMEEANRLQAQAESVMAELASPTERFAKKLKELNELKAKGFLSANQYDRAVSEAAKQLNETADAANRAHDAIQKVDAVLAGSAEATARVLEFRNMVQEQRGGGTGYKAQLQAQELLIKQGSSNLAGDKDAKQVDVLTEIRKLLDKQLKKPQIVLKPAGVT